MLNNFIEIQKTYNKNELVRLNKLSKLFNNYENKKTNLLKKYNNNELLQKNIKDIEKLQEYDNINNILGNKLYTLPQNFKFNILENFENITENDINSSIKKINLVYQYKYLNDEPVTGFGDFIRSCYFIYQFSGKYNIEANIHINEHPIKKYLYNFEKQPSINKLISKNIYFFKKYNYEYINSNNIITYKYKNIDNEFINYLNSLNIYEGNVYIYLINHPDEKYIENNQKEKILNILKPTDFLYNKVIHSMNQLKLIKNKFKVIHIRIEDEYREDNINKLNLYNRINYILKSIKLISLNSNDDIFLITNNNYFKNILIQKCPTLKTIFNEIAHTAYKETSDEKIINTLKDFYIMSNSNYIYSFSVYIHGSGFSKWCAVTYNIPYICYYLK